MCPSVDACHTGTRAREPKFALSTHLNSSLRQRLWGRGVALAAVRSRISGATRQILLEQSFVVFHRKPSALQLERHKHKVVALG